MTTCMMYCPPGRSSEPPCPGFLLGVSSIDTAGHCMAGLSPSPSRGETESTAPTITAWPKTVGKQRHVFGRTPQGFGDHLLGAEGKGQTSLWTPLNSLLHDTSWRAPGWHFMCTRARL